MYKNLWSMIVLVLLLVMLAACGAQPAAETAPAADSEASQEEVQPAEVEATTIEFWIPAGRGRDEGTAAVVEAFEAQNPNIKVEVTAIPFNEFANSLRVAYAGDTPPDVALTNGPEIPGLAYNGALLPIDDVFTEEDRNDFTDDLVDMVTFDGKMYGAPWAQAVVAMYYNKDHFETASIEVPQSLDEAWTWSEFLENVTIVQQHQAEQGQEIWGMVGLQSPITGAFFTWTMARSNSAPGDPLWSGISDDWTTVSGYVDTPEAKEAYAFYQALYTEGIAPRDDIPDAFGNGSAAVFMAIPPTGSVLDRNFPDLNWGVMPVPYFKTQLTHTGSFAPSVSAKSDNPEAAKAFVKFFTSPEGYLAYHAVTPLIPARKSLQAEIPELQDGYLAFLFETAIETGTARPGGPAYGIFNQIIAVKMMRDIALGNDIDETVSNAVAETDAQLAQFK